MRTSFLAILLSIGACLGSLGASGAFGAVGGIFAQEEPDFLGERVYAERYRKTIVSNGASSGSSGANRMPIADSTVGKAGLEARFFGDFNARIEYFLAPSFRPALGCRIFLAPDGASFVLEVKQVSNYREVEEALERELPWEAVYDSAANVADSREAYSRMIDEAYRERRRRSVERYAIDEISVSISDSLAERLYARTVGLVRYAGEAGRSAVQVLDGETVTFRCLVGGELWSLRFQEPTGDYQQLSDLFWEMITDAQVGNFREQVYFERLTSGFAQTLDVERRTVDPAVRYRRSVQQIEAIVDGLPPAVAGDSLTDEMGHEKLLFGDFQARLQFFVEPPLGQAGDRAAGCRIFRLTQDQQDQHQDRQGEGYVLEVKWIHDWMASAGTVPDSIAAEGEERIRAYFQETIDRMADRQRRGEEYTIYGVSVDISDRLVERLCARVAKVLRGAEAVGLSPHPILDGRTVLFRCMVGDELWSLNFYEPIGEYERLSDLFRELIVDVRSRQFEEAKYFRLVK